MDRGANLYTSLLNSLLKEAYPALAYRRFKAMAL